MKTVWVVEKGDYSDYRVVGVFSSRENAERVRDIENKDSYSEASVAEWPLDPVIEQLNQGMSRWNVHMLKDGNTERVELLDGIGGPMDDDTRIWRRSTAPLYLRKGVPDIMTATVWATDAEHAVKIVNEKRGQWIALGKWDLPGEESVAKQYK